MIDPIIPLPTTTPPEVQGATGPIEFNVFSDFLEAAAPMVAEDLLASLEGGEPDTPTSHIPTTTAPEPAEEEEIVAVDDTDADVDIAPQKPATADVDIAPPTLPPVDVVESGSDADPMAKRDVSTIPAILSQPRVVSVGATPPPPGGASSTELPEVVPPPRASATTGATAKPLPTPATAESIEQPEPHEHVRSVIAAPPPRASATTGATAKPLPTPATAESIEQPEPHEHVRSVIAAPPPRTEHHRVASRGHTRHAAPTPVTDETGAIALENERPNTGGSATVAPATPPRPPAATPAPPPSDVSSPRGNIDIAHRLARRPSRGPDIGRPEHREPTRPVSERLIDPTERDGVAIERSARSERGSRPMVARMVERIESWIRRSENMPPPRAMTIGGPHLDGMRLRVSIEGGLLSIQVQGASEGDLAWVKQVSGQLTEKGFDLSDVSEFDEHGHRRPLWEDDPTRHRRRQRFILNTNEQGDSHD